MPRAYVGRLTFLIPCLALHNGSVQLPRASRRCEWTRAGERARAFLMRANQRAILLLWLRASKRCCSARDADSFSNPQPAWHKHTCFISLPRNCLQYLRAEFRNVRVQFLRQISRWMESLASKQDGACEASFTFRLRPSNPLDLPHLFSLTTSRVQLLH